MASIPADETTTDQPSEDGTEQATVTASCNVGVGDFTTQEAAWQTEEDAGIELPPGEIGLKRTRSAGDVERILEHVPERRICVQAGGAVGSYPKELRRHFEVVYTFEPNPVLFGYLCKNVSDPNVIKMHCALGHKHQMTHMAHTEEYKWNMGAWWAEEGGIVPMLCLDDFEFPRLDLIYLDVEGWEGKILAGATETLRKHRPTVVAEYKVKIVRKHGEWLDWFKKEFGYEEVGKVGQDICLRSA